MNSLACSCSAVRRDTVGCLTSLNVLCRSGKDSFPVSVGLMRAFVNDPVHHFHGVNIYEQPGGRRVRFRVLLAPLSMFNQTFASSSAHLCRPLRSPQTSNKIEVKNLPFYKPVKFVDLIKGPPPSWRGKKTPVPNRDHPTVHGVC